MALVPSLVCSVLLPQPAIRAFPNVNSATTTATAVIGRAKAREGRVFMRGTIAWALGSGNSRPPTIEKAASRVRKSRRAASSREVRE